MCGGGGLGKVILGVGAGLLAPYIVPELFAGAAGVAGEAAAGSAATNAFADTMLMGGALGSPAMSAAGAYTAATGVIPGAAGAGGGLSSLLGNITPGQGALVNAGTSLAGSLFAPTPKTPPTGLLQSEASKVTPMPSPVGRAEILRKEQELVKRRGMSRDYTTTLSDMLG